LPGNRYLWRTTKGTCRQDRNGNLTGQNRTISWRCYSYKRYRAIVSAFTDDSVEAIRGVLGMRDRRLMIVIPRIQPERVAAIGIVRRVLIVKGLPHSYSKIRIN